MKIIVPAFFIVLSFNVNSSEETFQKLKKYNDYRGPGVALLKIKDGKVLQKDGFGLANIKKKQKIDSKTNFNIASNSKQFTAYAIYLLQQKGKLSLNDKVSKHLPELPAYAEEIEVKDLVFHTSGLPDYMEVCDSKKNIINKDVLELLKKKKSLEFSAGSAFEYSNTGYVLLSEIVERVSKKSFPTFIQEEIFTKLKMANSHVLNSNGEDNIKNQAISYSEWPFFKKQEKVVCDTVYGDGGIVTNLEDYAKWLNFTSSKKELFQTGKLKSGKSINYAFGWGISDYNGKKIILHSGSWNKYKSFSIYIPQKKTWVSMFANYEAPLSDLSKELALD